MPDAALDCSRWTTTLTASYLAITAALVAILGTNVPGRVWLIAVHLTLSGALLSLNRARPAAGILRVINDWHPLMLFPFLYKEVELLAGSIGDWRLTAAIPAWESALFRGQPNWYPERTDGVRAAVRVLAFLLPVLRDRHSICGSVLVRQRTAGGLRGTAAAIVDGDAGELLVLHRAAGGHPILPVAAPGPAALWPLFFDLVHRVSAYGGARGGAFPSAHVSGAVVVSLVAWRHQPRLAYLLVPITVSVMVATVYGRFHYALDVLAALAWRLPSSWRMRLRADHSPGHHLVSL